MEIVDEHDATAVDQTHRGEVEHDVCGEPGVIVQCVVDSDRPVAVEFSVRMMTNAGDGNPGTSGEHAETAMLSSGVSCQSVTTESSARGGSGSK